MQMCPNCDKVYDPTEYSRCPYCSGELEEEHSEKYYKICYSYIAQFLCANYFKS